MVERSFRFAVAGRFPAGSQLSHFGCACRVSTLPLFPRESAVLRCTSLFDDGWVGFNVQLCHFLQQLEWRVVVERSFRFAATGRFPAGS
ncbi:hypothetical protein Q0N12_13590 [Rossellomorea marisflavi]